ncbi:MAG: hypothetical protein ACF8CQ_06675 [Rhodopirellula sp. JB044]|uniref:hypothetical protein n=1 Tax=Rhodopirellula sp. JB044 TaxID=3342844 RepID=UPI00370BFF39
MLDIHALYWFIEGDVKLSNTAAAVIGEPTNTILFSPASYWEMAIKIGLGKWQLNQPYAEDDNKDENLWFLEDGDGGAITGLLPSDY